MGLFRARWQKKFLALMDQAKAASGYDDSEAARLAWVATLVAGEHLSSEEVRVAKALLAEVERSHGSMVYKSLIDSINDPHWAPTIMRHSDCNSCKSEERVILLRRAKSLATELNRPESVVRDLDLRLQAELAFSSVAHTPTPSERAAEEAAERTAAKENSELRPKTYNPEREEEAHRRREAELERIRERIDFKDRLWEGQRRYGK